MLMHRGLKAEKAAKAPKPIKKGKPAES